MCNKHKIQEILRHVWLPKSNFSNEESIYITDLICEIVGQFGDANDVSTLLNDESINKYYGTISSEKCEEVAKLIISWNGGSPLKTDYAVMKFRSGMYYTFLSYKNSEKELKVRFNMTVNDEVIVNLDELSLEGNEKQQLLDLMKKIYKNQLIIDNEENSEYIMDNLAYW
ncbi:hypothetical protein RFH42_15860 [Acinetobacter rudis]|uniref:hypothetical protein n=1 Tax=Acinetobacter rudis TaxID=632955 RepID=UPI00280F8C6E|nr:hypothetical protein [Acinetobacter rudis]MDQ8954425.1 hypothetical protein [Acinetobacter rudis]